MFEEEILNTNSRMGHVKEISDYKGPPRGRKGYFNVPPYYIQVEVMQQTLIIADAFDRFDSFIMVV